MLLHGHVFFHVHVVQSKILRPPACCVAQHVAIIPQCSGMHLKPCLQVAGAESDSDDNSVELDPIFEVAVSSSPEIKALVPVGQTWMLQDERGRLLRVDLPASAALAESGPPESSTLIAHHAAGVSQLLADPAGHYTVSAALDGTAWVHDLSGNVGICTQSFGSGITCLVPAADGEPSARCFAYFTGHQDGTLRRIVRCADGWKLTHACKPHHGSIVAVCLAPTGKHMATVASDGSVFFLAIDGSALQPIAQADLGIAPVGAQWIGAEVVVACQEPVLLRVTAPLAHAHHAAGTYTCAVAVKQLAVELPLELENQAEAAAAPVPGALAASVPLRTSLKCNHGIVHQPHFHSSNDLPKQAPSSEAVCNAPLAA